MKICSCIIVIMERIEPFRIEDLEQRNPVQQKKNVCIFFCKTDETTDGKRMPMDIQEIETKDERIHIVDKRSQQLTDRMRILERLEFADVKRDLIPAQAPQRVQLVTELSDMPKAFEPTEPPKEGKKLRFKEEEEVEEEEKPEPIEKPKIIRKRKEKPGINKEEEERMTTQVALNTVKIGQKIVAKRLPPPRKFAVKVSNYYLNNRKMYVQNLSQIFKPYRDPGF